jgi:hypothetical protein
MTPLKKTAEPDNVTYYPIAGSPLGGALYLFGSPSAKSIALLSAGFPDDHAVFLPFASKLANETDTLVGVTCLPGYHDRLDHPWTEYKKDGYTFDEMTNAVREAMKALRLHSTYLGKPKIIGIFHDWGVAPGCIWANRAKADNVNVPDELILFDVLPGPHPETKGGIPQARKPTIYEIIVTFYYRIIFASSFLAQRYLGTSIATIGFLIAVIFLKLFRLSPTLSIDAKVFAARKNPLKLERMIYMMYPYVKMFQALYSGKGFGGFTLPQDLSLMPVLYMYGTEKRIMFHDEASTKLLEREHKEGRSKSNSIAVDGAGHYLYSEIQKLDYCVDCVKEFILKK